jgi:hypothetical protein
VRPAEVAPTGIEVVRIGGVAWASLDDLAEWVRRAQSIDDGPVAAAVRAEFLAAIEELRR